MLALHSTDSRQHLFFLPCHHHPQITYSASSQEWSKFRSKPWLGVAKEKEERGGWKKGTEKNVMVHITKILGISRIEVTRPGIGKSFEDCGFQTFYPYKPAENVCRLAAENHSLVSTHWHLVTWTSLLLSAGWYHYLRSASSPRKKRLLRSGSESLALPASSPCKEPLNDLLTDRRNR